LLSRTATLGRWHYFGLASTFILVSMAARPPLTDGRNHDLPQGALLWRVDMTNAGYPRHPSESFKNTFGSGMSGLSFLDGNTLIATFITSEPDTLRNQHEGRPDTFRLRLHAVVFEAATGTIQAQHDWPATNPNDGVIATFDEKIVIRTGDKINQYSSKLEFLRGLDVSLALPPEHRIFDFVVTPSGHFIQVKLLSRTGLDYLCVNADSFEVVRSPSGASGSKVQDCTGHENIRDEIIQFRYNDADAELLRGNGQPYCVLPVESRRYLSRPTFSSDGQRVALTAAVIHNVLELLGPYQWEYVRQVLVFDLQRCRLICEVEVKKSKKNQDSRLALSGDGSLLGIFRDGVVEIYRIPGTPTTQSEAQ
jgi:hypothetical protein